MEQSIKIKMIVPFKSIDGTIGLGAIVPSSGSDSPGGFRSKLFEGRQARAHARAVDDLAANCSAQHTLHTEYY